MTKSNEYNNYHISSFNEQLFKNMILLNMIKILVSFIIKLKYNESEHLVTKEDKKEIIDTIISVFEKNIDKSIQVAHQQKAEQIHKEYNEQLDVAQIILETCHQEVYVVGGEILEVIRKFLYGHFGLE
jgi:hypothetical protein